MTYDRYFAPNAAPEPEQEALKGVSGVRLAEEVQKEKQPKKEQPAKELKLNTTDLMMNEVIMYGGVPMTRANVQRHALKATGDRKAADLFAFGPRTELAPKDAKPWSLADMETQDYQFAYRSWLRSVWGKDRKDKPGPEEPEGVSKTALHELRNEIKREVGKEMTGKKETPRDLGKGELITDILAFTKLKKGSVEYEQNVKALSVLHTYELQGSLRDLRAKESGKGKPESKLQSIRKEPAVRRDGSRWVVYNPDSKHYGEELVSFDTEKEADDYARNYADVLQAHDDRSPLSRASDERQSNLNTIDPDDPRTTTWSRDPGRMDVRGIDTPARKRKKTKARNCPTEEVAVRQVGR